MKQIVLFLMFLFIVISSEAQNVQVWNNKQCAEVLQKRSDEWRLAAKNGHELGNHTLFHPCDGSRPGRNS